jgi:replicative DNA helicase
MASLPPATSAPPRSAFRRTGESGGGAAAGHGSIVRIPPHNFEAEESLLGAMLLSRDAIAVATEEVSAADFYKPSHAHIFTAISTLYARGEPADAVTVAEEMRRQGTLDASGGASALISLQANTPAISSATRYAGIVSEHAVLRRLIGVAYEIAEIGYEVPPDVGAALDHAESMVFDVAQRRASDTTRSLKDLLTESLDHLEYLVGRGEEITGVPTGYTDLDSHLYGLQASNLIVVGARPSMGKTAFALGLAANAAKAGVPVLFFSLEMSHLELAQRVLCAESRVDAGRLRNGRVFDSDWAKIAGAIGRIGEAPLYIDDNPSVTVMDVRSKARRMKSQEGGLGLVIVDYLQLMTGRSTSESRQVEISEMSRGLKLLARELKIPVVACSQLSRSLEQRADKRPMLADLRECLAGSTRIVRADTNAEVTIGEIARSGESRIPVWSLDEDYKLVPAVMTEAWSTGLRPVLELRFASGRTLKATANHPLLSLSGWVQVGDLLVGDRIAGSGRFSGPAAPVDEPFDVPAAVWDYILQKGLTSEGISAKQLARAVGTGDIDSLRGADVSREWMQRLADALGDRWLNSLANSDVYWDRVVSIEPAGSEEVFDAHVEQTHSFLANGIISHNSGAIEQDADVVMFLYRDEVYNPETSDAGVAEIHISKHRNGPTGVAKLSFQNNIARFGNLAKI